MIATRKLTLPNARQAFKRSPIAVAMRERQEKLDVERRKEQRKRDKNAAKLMRWTLARLFPKAFVAPGSSTPRRPLKVDIKTDIYSRAPELDRWIVSLAVRDYCTGQKYLAACVAGAPRIDLDGNACGEVNVRGAAYAAAKFVEATTQKKSARRTGASGIGPRP
jgi:sRNA-binding protein